MLTAGRQVKNSDGRRNAVQPRLTSDANSGQPQARETLTNANSISGGIAKRCSGGSIARQSPAKSHAGVRKRRRVRSASTTAFTVSV